MMATNRLERPADRRPRSLLYVPAAMEPNLRKLVAPGRARSASLLIVVAIIYFVEPAHSLPSFFPGHVSATSAEANHHHTKHGIAALVVALALLRLRLVPDRAASAAGAAEPPGSLAAEREHERADQRRSRCSRRRTASAGWSRRSAAGT